MPKQRTREKVMIDWDDKPATRKPKKAAGKADTNSQPATRKTRVPVSSLLSKAGWLVVVISALALSAYSLFFVARHYGLPVILAGLVSAAFDGAAMVCADLAIKYAKSHSDSGFGPRMVVLLMAGTSAYLNTQHAAILHEPLAARILYAVPPLTAVTLVELHLRWERRNALRRAGRIAESLPVFGRWAYLLFPVRTVGVLRNIIAYRLDIIESKAGVSANRSYSASLNGNSQAVRTWAKLHGMNVGDRGRIPGHVIQAYETSMAGNLNGASDAA